MIRATLKDCDNCKYCDVPGWGEPCENCRIDDDTKERTLWESPIVKECTTCEFYNNLPSDKPCDTCIILVRHNLTDNWRERT